MEIHKEAYTHTQKETNTKTQKSIKKTNIQSNFEKKKGWITKTQNKLQAVGVY